MLHGLQDARRAVLWDTQAVWHNADMSHMDTESHSYPVQVGERGRVVLPAPLRRELDVQEGDQLLLVVTDGAVRLVKPRDLADAARGLFADDSGRSLIDELLAERHAEAEREAHALAAR